MFIELHMRPKDSKGKYSAHLLNVDKITIITKIIPFSVNNVEQEIKESYDDIKKILDKHNLLITK